MLINTKITVNRTRIAFFLCDIPRRTHVVELSFLTLFMACVIVRDVAAELSEASV